jgi:predicted nuclease of restriction endonuclease-like (RecB) superfamily
MQPTYADFLTTIKTRIQQAQYDALKVVNQQLIGLYWDMGRMIVEKQETEGWGKSVVEQLSKDLQAEFPGISGFSARNIWNMRLFYLTYRDNSILQPLVAEIAWSHNVLILEKCKDDLQREFYLKMARKFGWTKNVLANQLAGQAYEKYLLNQTNFDQTVSETYRQQAKLAVKDEYTFGFLELATSHSESELENAIIRNIRRFLLEMGGYYAFLGNQYRLEAGGQEYFIDLLLFHRKLRCLVALELKIGEFKPEYAGKMQFYLAVLNDTVKLPDENASIGIIICQHKNRTIVEYALKTTDQPIGVSAYTFQEELPQEFQHLLPSPEEIRDRLQVLDL